MITKTFKILNRGELTAEVREETEEFYKIRYRVRKYGGLGLPREEYLKKTKVLEVIDG